jgi:hypothetical protein
MKQHSALNRGIMFEWLKDLDDTGDRCPSDEAIMERFDFDTPDQSRTLLADLADKGLITVRGVGADRIVTIGKGASFVASPVERPIPSVVKADAQVDRGVARIMQAFITPTATGKPPREVQVVPKPMPREFAPPDPPRTRHQVNIKVSAEQFAHLTNLAKTAGASVGKVALLFLERGMSGAVPEPIHKPLIRAHVIRAARDAGIPIEEFVPALIECGLQRFLADPTRDMAA